MKSNYNHEDEYVEYECGCCKYSYKEYWKTTSNYGERKEPFISGETEFLCTEKIDYYPDRLIKKTIYACPKCGVLQIEV